MCVPRAGPSYKRQESRRCLERGRREAVISVNPLSALIPTVSPPPLPAPGARARTPTPAARGPRPEGRRPMGAPLTPPPPPLRAAPAEMTPSPALLLLLPPLLLGALPPAAAARGESWRPARRPGLRQRRPFPSGPQPCPSARLARACAPPLLALRSRPLTGGAPQVARKVVQFTHGPRLHPWGTPSSPTGCPFNLGAPIGSLLTLRHLHCTCGLAGRVGSGHGHTHIHTSNSS